MSKAIAKQCCCNVRLNIFKAAPKAVLTTVRTLWQHVNTAMVNDTIGREHQSPARIGSSWWTECGEINGLLQSCLSIL
jgi:hypothetical protein